MVSAVGALEFQRDALALVPAGISKTRRYQPMLVAG